MATGFNNERLEPLIFRVRGHRVVLDADLARLYGVPTFRFNGEEFTNLRSQLATSSSQAVDFSSHNSSQFARSSSRHRGAPYRPWAFTEHGALMAANVLRSDRAVQMSVFVVRAFVRLREQVAANTAILKRLAEIDKTLLEHDSALRDVYQKRRSGFHTDSD